MADKNELLGYLGEIEKLGEINLVWPALLDNFDNSLSGVHVPEVLLICAEKIDEIVERVNRLKKEIENDKK